MIFIPRNTCSWFLLQHPSTSARSAGISLVSVQSWQEKIRVPGLAIGAKWEQGERLARFNPANFIYVSNSDWSSASFHALLPKSQNELFSGQQSSSRERTETEIQSPRGPGSPPGEGAAASLSSAAISGASLVLPLPAGNGFSPGPWFYYACAQFVSKRSSQRGIKTQCVRNVGQNGNFKARKGLESL